jgi:hypothetical protein
MKITVELEPRELQELLSFNPFGQQSPVPVRSDRIAIPTKTIREWARSKGLAVAKGGTLPKDVIEAYYEDQGISHG